MKIEKRVYKFSFLVLFIIFTFLSFSSLCSQECQLAKRPRFLLFITIDGFRPDYVELYEPKSIKEIISQGVRVRKATTIFPSLTTPAMCSLITGAYPKTTGIACNSQYVKELDKIVSSPRDNKAETIAETLQKHGWKTAAINQFMLENRGVNIYKSVGYDNSTAVTEAIFQILENNQAQFIAVIYGKTDSIGHKYGPFSEEMKKTVFEIDREIGKIISFLKKKNIYNETLIVLSSDHGMSPFEKKQANLEPIEALKKAGFKVATKNEEIGHETEIIVISAGVRLIYQRKPLSKEKYQKLINSLKSIEGVDVWEKNKLAELGCHPDRSGDLVVVPKPGYCLSGAGEKGGLHGRPTEMNTLLILSGPGIKKGILIEEAKTIDIVPTVLHLLGIKPPSTVDGKIIKEALELKY